MTKKIHVFSFALLAMLVLQACVPGTAAQADPAPIPMTGAEEIEETEAMPMEAEEAPISEEMQESAQGSIDEQAVVEEEVQEEMKEESPMPVHNTIPGQTILIDVQTVTDCLSGGSRVEGQPIIVGTGCDVWPRNSIERPFDNTMVEYDPNLDIVMQQLGYDDEFFFARITLHLDELISPDLRHSYGIELDLDVDEDGDLLIYVVNPAQLGSGEWRTEGVYILQDADDDVGGAVPVLADDQPYEGTGYEVLLYENGYGEDADAAFARLASGKDHAVEIAFKRYLVGEPDSFLWWMWAVEGEMLPGSFDYVDIFSAEEKYRLDNTCRWVFGAPPNANLANSCPVWTPPPTPGPGQDAPPPPRQPDSPNDPPPVIIN